MRTIKCCSVVFGVKVRLLVIHFVVVSRHQQTRSLLATSVINSLWSVVAQYIALGVHSTWWSQILAQNRDFCLPHLYSTPQLGGGGYRQNIAILFNMKKKREWFGYPMVKKIWRCVYSFWQNSRTWRTDTQTDIHTDTAWRHRPPLHSIARPKVQKMA